MDTFVEVSAWLVTYYKDWEQHDRKTCIELRNCVGVLFIQETKHRVALCSRLQLLEAVDNPATRNKATTVAIAYLAKFIFIHCAF